KAVAEQMMAKLVAAETLRNSPELIARLRQIMEACPAATIENALLAMRDRPDRTAMLASIAVPALIVVGKEDSITPPAVSEAMRKKIPNAELVVIEGAGHMS